MNICETYFSESVLEYFLEIAVIEYVEDKNSLHVWAEQIPNIHSGQNLDNF